MGFSNSALDISGDGSLIAYGWPTLQVSEWNGSSYQSLWTWNPGGMYVNRIAISNDGNTIVSCWYNTSFNTIKVAVHDKSSSTPLWTHDYVVSNGTYQEIAGDVDITDDGKYFVVGSWGDASNLNPEIHIFQRDNVPCVYYTVDMPGSMFSVDIGNDGLYATACGKHIHGNAMGRGGDIVMINNDLVAVSENKPVNKCKETHYISIKPNPSKGTVQITYAVVGNPQMAKLLIYNVSGQIVKSFDVSSRSTDYGLRSAVIWSGTDQNGRSVPAGVYFVKLTADYGSGTSRLVLAR
jgi:hypothetical protein